MSRRFVYPLILLFSLFVMGAGLAAIVSLPAVAEGGVDNQCTLLDDLEARYLMGGMLETRLLLACGREHELGGDFNRPEFIAPVSMPVLGPDVLVNDPTGDAGGVSHTQSETSIALNENTGTICSGYNDSYHGVVQGQGYTGFSRSTDGGATFTDGGALSSSSFGDPSLIWRRSDGKRRRLPDLALAVCRSD